MAQMKVLVVCYEYPPIGGGGGRVARSIAEQLVARGHEVRVQTAGMSHLAGRETLNGVEIFRTPSFRRREDTCAVHEMALFLLTSFFPMLVQMLRWRPDVVHAHFAMPTGILAWAGYRLLKVPYILTAHLGDVPGAVPKETETLFRMVNPIAWRVWHEAAAVTAVSEFVRELAVEAYQRPVTKILNGIDLARRPPAPSVVKKERHLVFVGRFNPQKNLLFLIDVLAQLLELPWKITIIGDGALMRSVGERLAEHRMQTRARLTGWLTTAEVHAILRQADILCMPSTVEGMPVAAVEALKFGLAIVGSAIPGLRDVTEHGVNGFLLPVGDAHGFTAALRQLMTDDALLTAMKSASYLKVHDFALERVAALYEQLLKEAAASGTRDL